MIVGTATVGGLLALALRLTRPFDSPLAEPDARVIRRRGPRHH